MILDYLFSLLPILSLATLGFNGVDQFPVVMPAVPYRLNIFFHKECIVEVIQFKIVDFSFLSCLYHLFSVHGFIL